MGSLLWTLVAATATIYTLSAVAHLLYMFRSDFDQLARWSTRVGWLVQSLGLLVLVLHTGRAPVGTLFEFAYLFTWFLLSNYLLIELLRKNQAAGSFLMPVIAAIQIGAVALPGPPEHLQAADSLPIGLIGWHIGVTMLGYGFFFASFVAGALYLLQERHLRLKRWGPAYYRLPSLEWLDIWGGRFVSIGFPLLTIGMLSGLIFAHVTWATFWQADAKVLFTLFVWAVYGGYLLMRSLWGWGGRRAAWWSVVGVAGLLINYFVMNMLSTLHRYGV